MINLGGILPTIAFLRQKSGDVEKIGIGTTSKDTETDVEDMKKPTKKSWKQRSLVMSF